MKLEWHYLRVRFCGVALLAMACDPPASLPPAGAGQHVQVPSVDATPQGGVAAQIRFSEVRHRDCSDPLTFDDPRLEAAVRKAIHNPHGAVAPSDVAELQELFVHSSEALEELGGIECLSGLRRLDVTSLGSFSRWPRQGSRSMATDLTPLARLTELEALQLYVRYGTDLTPLAWLPKLRELHLSFDDEGDLRPLARLSNLELLDLSDTPVTDVRPLSGLASLKVLDLSGTPLRDIRPLSELTSLDVLALEHTAVDCVDQAAAVLALGSRIYEFVLDCPSDIATSSSVCSVCSLPIEGGTCGAFFPAFGFDTSLGRCRDFAYSGCEGNANRFETLDECIEGCDPAGRDREFYRILRSRVARGLFTMPEELGRRFPN